MTANELAAALAARAEEVCRRYLPRGRKEGRYWQVGNVQGDAGRSLVVGLAPSERPGRWTDATTGESGDLLDLLRCQYDDAAANEASQFIAQCGPPVSCGAARRGARATDAVRRMWSMCRPVEGTHAEVYLRARRITCCGFPSLRFHPALHYHDGTGVQKWPALVAQVTNHRGDFVGVHRTYLDTDRAAKAPVATPSKWLGAIGGSAVYLGKRQPTLVVAEGIETALSLLTAHPGLYVAAALSAGSLAGFTPPASVTGLVIARDLDEAGAHAHAAERLRVRCERKGVGVLVIAPRMAGDFNDELRAYGPQDLARLVSGAAAEFKDPSRGAWATAGGWSRDRPHSSMQ